MVVKADQWEMKDYVTVMVKAYIFGVSFSVAAFCKAILYQVIDYVLPRPSYTRFHAIVFAYQSLSWDDVLLQFLVAFHCNFCDGGAYSVSNNEECDSEKGLSQLKEAPELLLALLAIYANRANRGPRWFKEDLAACDYRGHATAKECESCEEERKSRASYAGTVARVQR